MKKNKKIFLIITLIVTAFIGFKSINASTNSLTIFYEGEDRVGVNEEYIVEIKVKDIQGGLAAISSIIDYDKEYLEFISAEGINNPYVINYVEEVNKINGMSFTGEVIDYDCTIVRLKFKALKAGNTNLGFLEEVYVDRNAKLITSNSIKKSIKIYDASKEKVTFEITGRQYYNFDEEANLQINISKIDGKNIAEIYGTLDYIRESNDIISVEPASNNVDVTYDKDTKEVFIKSLSSNGFTEGDSLIKVTLKANASCNMMCNSHIIIKDPFIINIDNLKMSFEYKFFMFMYTPKPEYTLKFVNSGKSNAIFGTLEEVKDTKIQLINSNGISKLKSLSGKIEYDDSLIEIVGIDFDNKNIKDININFNSNDKTFTIISNSGLNVNDIILTIRTIGKDMGFSRINITNLEGKSLDNRNAIINCNPSMLVFYPKSEANIFIDGNTIIPTNSYNNYELKVQNNIQYPIYKISGQFIYDKSKIHIFASDEYFDDKLIEFNEDTGEFTITKHNFEGFNEEEIIFDFYVLAKNITGSTNISINNIKALDTVEREMTINSQVKTISIN